MTLDNVISAIHRLAIRSSGDDQRLLYEARRYLSLHEGLIRDQRMADAARTGPRATPEDHPGQGTEKTPSARNP